MRFHARHRAEQQLHALAADELPDEQQIDFAVRDGGRASVMDGDRRRFDGNLLRGESVRDEARLHELRDDDDFREARHRALAAALREDAPERGAPVLMILNQYQLRLSLFYK